MILKTEYINNTKEVYVTLISEGLPGVCWFCVFDAKDFNNVGGVPYSKEELLENTKLNISSMNLPYIKSKV